MRKPDGAEATEADSIAEVTPKIKGFIFRPLPASTVTMPFARISEGTI
jgi:hypothetical protein